MSADRSMEQCCLMSGKGMNFLPAISEAPSIFLSQKFRQFLFRLIHLCMCIACADPEVKGQPHI